MEAPEGSSSGSGSKHPEISARYTLHETIGEGGFGKVKRATKKSNGEVVAVKIIDKAAIKDVEDVNRYTREFAILNSIQHKNIIRLHELQQNDHFFYVVMDLCTGDLNDIIKKEGRDPPNLEIVASTGERRAARKVLTEEVARDYIKQVVAGVEYSHRNNIIHRDLKQENVLIDTHGNLRLCDFGLSALPADTDDMLRTVAGTLHYMAPEILEEKGYAGCPVDVWAIGVMLYEMTVGLMPFGEGENQEKDLVRCILRKHPAMPKSISRSLRDLLQRMLAKNPESRITIPEVQNHGWFLGMSLDDSLVQPSLAEELGTLTLQPAEVELPEEESAAPEDAAERERRGPKPAGSPAARAGGRPGGGALPVPRRRMSEEGGPGAGAGAGGTQRRRMSEEGGGRGQSRERGGEARGGLARGIGEPRRRSTTSPEPAPRARRASREGA